MSESEKRMAEAIANQVLNYLQDAHGTICPLGMTVGDVQQIKTARRLFWWAGAIFAGSLIAAFAAGAWYVLIEGFKVAVGR